MIGRLKRIVRRHPVITYLLAVLIMIGEFCCMAHLIFTDSDKTLWLAFPTLLTTCILAAAEQIRTAKTIRQDAYISIIRRINRLN